MENILIEKINLHCETCQTELGATHSRARFCSLCRQKRRKANILGLKELNRIYTFTPIIDKLILDIYSKKEKKRGDIMLLSKKTNIPRYALYKRARQLRINEKIVRKWSKEELNFIKNQINSSVAIIYRLFLEQFPFRTKQAIVSKLKSIRSRARPDTYTAENLSICLGVHPDTVEGWIKKGLLKAHKIGNLYSITAYDIKNFIQYHPNRFKLSNVDQIWFLDLVFDGKINNNKS